MKKLITLIVLAFSFTTLAADSEIKLDGPAKTFKLKTNENKDFDLASRKGSWTVLYFFPKAETPGCTKQACSFRDNIKKIRDLKAEVYGISTNNVKDQAEFHKAHALNFILLADDKGEVTNLYGSKMPLLNMSKRWTFIIDPDLVVRDIAKDVDPITDSQRVATRISELQKK